ncbi:MAG TPA: hypothetical protein PLV68_14110, partial [Ilumatobacteraceae bacterium]|nr:hypothetical protein [Ilumatobacteraceae bacterium]
ASAAEHYQAALRLFRASGDLRGVAYVLAGLGSLSLAQGRARQAARFFGAVRALRAAVGPFLEAPLQVEHDRDLAAAMCIGEWVGRAATIGAGGELAVAAETTTTTTTTTTA